MNEIKGINYLSSGIAVIFTAIQSEQLLQIISLILTCISVAVSLSFTIYKWYKKAKEDGKITKEEIKDLKNEIKEKIKKE